TISLYIGTPVVALSKYLENFTYFFRNFGEETLIGLNNFMSTLNIKINMGNAARNHEFVRLGNMPTRTNIYTSFRSILNDYGYLGMLFYQFSVGFFISYIYEKIKRDHSVNQSFQILIYAFIIRYL